MSKVEFFLQLYLIEKVDFLIIFLIFLSIIFYILFYPGPRSGELMKECIKNCLCDQGANRFFFSKFPPLCACGKVIFRTASIFALSFHVPSALIRTRFLTSWGVLFCLIKGHCFCNMYVLYMCITYLYMQS